MKRNFKSNCFFEQMKEREDENEVVFFFNANTSLITRGLSPPPPARLGNVRAFFMMQRLQQKFDFD